ncbi:hypothetical protein Hamer_G018188 [Homarus americanus]|uniref:Uncharacterized protein n=1 Tax=Homarus americanus TaxID=6706 RepID=A0A8J5MKD6_HOMAM|nr:hypothetical protein Hamer_G018188 [Homarus americanus]
MVFKPKSQRIGTKYMDSQEDPHLLIMGTRFDIKLKQDHFFTEINNDTGILNDVAPTNDSEPHGGTDDPSWREAAPNTQDVTTLDLTGVGGKCCRFGTCVRETQSVPVRALVVYRLLKTRQEPTADESHSINRRLHPPTTEILVLLKQGIG